MVCGRTCKAMWSEIDQAIRNHDKLVFVASEASLKSTAVNLEIERAILRQDELKKQQSESRFNGDTDVLFPVRLDNFILEGWNHERKADVVKKVIADARSWDKQPGVYEGLLTRLLTDLRPAAVAKP